MIVNVGGRTDIVNYYTPWLMNRLNEGFVYSRNPLFPKGVSKIDLSPEKVDCLMFCSKNYKPILKYMDILNNRGIIDHFYNKYVIADNMLKLWLNYKKEMEGHYPS